MRKGSSIPPGALAGSPFAQLPFWVVAAVIGATLLFTGCHSSSSPKEDDDQTPAATMAVSAVAVTSKPMRAQMRLLGETVALRHIFLRAPSAGRVLGFNIEIGDQVRRGQVVAHILSREVEAAENGLAVARQIDPSEAQNLRNSVRRYSHGNGIAVTVPENAIVAQRMVSSGQMVADLDQLADLIDPHSIFVNAAVPVDDLAAIRPGMEASVTSPLHPRADYPARVAAVSPSFNQAGATSPVRIEFTGPDRILEAGAPVEVQVTLRYVADAIIIPAVALFEDAANDSYYVFVAGADGRAHRTSVITGIRQPDEVQITTGLQSGQMVITSGGYALSDNLKIKLPTAAGPQRQVNLP